MSWGSFDYAYEHLNVPTTAWLSTRTEVTCWNIKLPLEKKEITNERMPQSQLHRHEGIKECTICDIICNEVYEGTGVKKIHEWKAERREKNEIITET